MGKKTTTTDAVKLAALEARLIDIAQGSMGHCDFDWIGGDDGSGGLAYTMGIPEWIRWVLAVKKIFACRGSEAGLSVAPAESVAFELWNLHYFSDSIEVAAAHLFNLGARP